MDKELSGLERTKFITGKLILAVNYFHPIRLLPWPGNAREDLHDNKLTVGRHTFAAQVIVAVAVEDLDQALLVNRFTIGKFALRRTQVSAHMAGDVVVL